MNKPGADVLSERLMDALGGLSPLICREAALYAAGSTDARVEGLDAEEGIRNCGSKKLFLELLHDFSLLIDSKSLKMQKLLDDNMIRDYTIEVHALKNTARMIGAMELSELCYQLEQCGNKDDVEILQKKTPEMLSLYRRYKNILAPYIKKHSGEKNDVTTEEILEQLDKLRDSIDNFDIDGADEAGHDGQTIEKKEFIEKVDEVVMSELIKLEDVYIYLTADHSTPISVKNHSGDPVPVLIRGPEVRTDDVTEFSERACAKGGLNRIRGSDVMNIMMDLMNYAHKFGA